jgi:hypothetical protein
MQKQRVEDQDESRKFIKFSSKMLWWGGRQIIRWPPVRVNKLLFSLHDYIQIAIIRKQKLCNTRLEVEKAALLIQRTEKNTNMPYQFRGENRIHKARTTSIRCNINSTIALP